MRRGWWLRALMLTAASNAKSLIALQCRHTNKERDCCRDRGWKMRNGRTRRVSCEHKQKGLRVCTFSARVSRKPLQLPLMETQRLDQKRAFQRRRWRDSTSTVLVTTAPPLRMFWVLLSAKILLWKNQARVLQRFSFPANGGTSRLYAGLMMNTALHRMCRAQTQAICPAARWVLREDGYRTAFWGSTVQ